MPKGGKRVAVLLDADRQAVWEAYMRLNLGLAGLVKAEMRAAVDAVDAWVNSNSTSFNNAIPLPARTALTASQKARLLLAVVERRYLAGV
jgi:hypothetical protein